MWFLSEYFKTLYSRVDLKENTKARLVDVKSHQTATGGGPPLPAPTHMDKNLTEIISSVAFSANIDIRESRVLFKFEDNKEVEVNIGGSVLIHR